MFHSFSCDTLTKSQIRSRLRPDLRLQIRPNTSLVVFKKSKSDYPVHTIGEMTQYRQSMAVVPTMRLATKKTRNMKTAPETTKPGKLKKNCSNRRSKQHSEGRIESVQKIGTPILCYFDSDPQETPAQSGPRSIQPCLHSEATCDCITNRHPSHRNDECQRLHLMHVMKL